MKILVLNGPNLNMLGIREPGIYGNSTYDDLISLIVKHCSENGVDVVCSQSNHEGELVDMIQQAYFDKVDGIVINPGGDPLFIGREIIMQILKLEKMARKTPKK